MSIRVIPLGINGFFPSFGRHTMSILVTTGSEVFLLDAGTGVARLQESAIADLVRPYDHLNVILSHYHLDHIVGLPYLSGVWRQGPVRIYAPGKPFVDAEPDRTLRQFLGPPHFPVSLDDYPIPIEIVPIKEYVVQIQNLSFLFRAQHHPGGSAGIRLGNELAYVTDTTVEKGTEAFIKGVKLLMHEVYLTDAEAEEDDLERSRHSSPTPVGNLAEGAGVRSLMAIHHHPKRSNDDIRKLAQDIKNLAKLDVLIPEEGRVYELD